MPTDKEHRKPLVLESELLKRGRYGAAVIHRKNMAQKQIEALGIWFTRINDLVHDLHYCSICSR